MSDFGNIKKVETLRAYYKATTAYTSNEQTRELREIANELKVANDLKEEADEKITNATGSPYLKDQPWYKKDVVLNSEKQEDWRDVKSYEDARQEVLIFKNLKKLNIL